MAHRDGRWALGPVADLAPRVPTRFVAGEVELVAVRTDEGVHVLHGRCPHRNAPLSDASVEAGSLVCPHHGWDFELATGRSRGIPGEAVARFGAKVEDGLVWVADADLEAWRTSNAAVFTEADDVQ
jgi:phenylpropionate dioxygenase-like ring-hydroxylating dioxygenase large terminal subunit